MSIRNPLHIRLAVTITLLLTAAMSFGQSIPWGSNYAKALELAKKTGKPILVFFHADWCQYCQRMKAGTLRDQNVVKVMKSVIPVSLNAETDGKALKAKLGAKMYPAFIFVAPNGAKFTEINGYHTPIMFRDEVQKRVSAIAVRDQLLSAIKKRPSDGETNARLAWLYAIQEEETTSLKHLEYAKKAKYQGAFMASALNMIGDVFQLSERFDKAIEYFRDSMNYPGTTADKSYSLVSLYSCYLQKGDTKRANEYGNKLLRMPGASQEYVDFVRQRMRKSSGIS
jgi:thioredoxin-related protein